LYRIFIADSGELKWSDLIFILPDKPRLDPQEICRIGDFLFSKKTAIVTVGRSEMRCIMQSLRQLCLVHCNDHGKPSLPSEPSNPPIANAGLPG
jgi:hypothetical protein